MAPSGLVTVGDSYGILRTNHNTGSGLMKQDIMLVAFGELCLVLQSRPKGAGCRMVGLHCSPNKENGLFCCLPTISHAIRVSSCLSYTVVHAKPISDRDADN